LKELYLLARLRIFGRQEPGTGFSIYSMLASTLAAASANTWLLNEGAVGAEFGSEIMTPLNTYNMRANGPNSGLPDSRTRRKGQAASL
jgi:hypothetical protein